MVKCRVIGLDAHDLPDIVNPAQEASRTMAANAGARLHGGAFTGVIDAISAQINAARGLELESLAFSSHEEEEMSRPTSRSSSAAWVR